MAGGESHGRPLADGDGQQGAPLSAAELGGAPSPLQQARPAAAARPQGSPTRGRVEPGMRIGPDGQLQVDPVYTFLRHGGCPERARIDVERVPRSVNGAERLAAAGQWHDAARVAADVAAAEEMPPAERMRALHAQALALAQQGSRVQAAELLGRLPPATVAAAPFSLRLLRAELLAAHPQPQPQDAAAAARGQAPPPRPAEQALHALLDACAAALRDPGTDNQDRALWERRQREVLLRLVHCHVDQKQMGCALQRMRDLVTAHPQDLRLRVQLACLHMSAGQVQAARAVFAQMAELGETPEVATALSRVMGFLEICEGDFKGAASQFDDILRGHPRDVSAQMNKAVCEVYTCRLPHAVQVLEETIRTDPRRALTPALVYNLCTLYDLESDQSTKKKRVVKEMVERFLGDDFPQDTLKLSS